MKKKYCYLTAIALLGLAACSEDMDPVNGGINNGGASALNGRIPLTFRLDGLTGGAVPYTRADIALEKETEIRTLDVFVFGKDTLPDGSEKPNGQMLLEEVFRSGVSEGIELTVDGTVQKAELSVLGRNRKRLYFVANGRDHAALNKFEMGKTDTLAFRDGVTDALAGHISCPLLMTTDKELSVTDSIAKHPTSTDWATKIPISLKRRMARFDIVNTGADSQFFIEWIQLQNARKQNYLFEDAAHTKPYFAASELFDPERIDFKSQDNANNGETLASFYVYAAERSSSPAAPTKDFSLVLGGKSGSTGEGAAVLYPVLMRTKQDDDATALEVKANNRYVINIKSMGSNVITADIKVNDWLIGDTVKVESGYGIFGLSMPAVDPKGTMDKNTLTLTSADIETDILVNVAADTEWEVTTDCDWISLAGGTPVAGTVGKTLTFATTKANPRNDASRIGRIIFRNKMRPSITQTLLVEQPKTAADFLHVNVPTKVTGLSVEGDTIRLSGGVEKVSFPLSGTDLTSVSASFDESTIATAAISTGNDAVELTMADNTTGADRKGVLTVSVGDLEQKYNIVQKSKSLGMIVLTGSGIIDRVIELGAADTYGKAITVAASSAWTFDGVDNATSGATIDSWITLSEATGTDGNGSFKLTTTANDTYEAREAAVKIVNTKNPGISSILTIKQAAKAESIALSATNLTNDVLSIAYDKADAITVTVAAGLKDGGEWELKDAGNTLDNWLTLGTKTEGNNDFTITPSANNTFAEREVTVTVQKVDDTTIKKEITVKQAAKVESITATATGLTGNDLSIAIGSTDIITVAVAADLKDNATWEVAEIANSPIDGWLTIDNKTENGFDLTPSDNSGNPERSAKITIRKVGDETIQQEITVTQAGV